MKAKLYLETTIVSYLVARPSRDLVVAAHQEQTRNWWEQRRGDFDIRISQVVLDEAKVGEPQMAAKRLELLRPFPLLTINPETVRLAEQLIRSGPLPAKAARDATHIALSAIYGVHF
ncbi:MAG: type II toxin-antitoxin system VapC family toxin [Verrucomicrobiales bacterium]|nr:type II toxin-antitoxin system VapC family toxin [Verrucomicrobiales bacterium]